LRAQFETSRLKNLVAIVFPLSILMIGYMNFGTAAEPADQTDSSIVDLSLMVGTDYPCTWPQGAPYFQMNHYKRIGPGSTYNSDVLTIDQNTGTQIDFPPHSLSRPGSNRPNASPYGSHFGDKIKAWQFGGEACVIDIRQLLDKAPNGFSPLVRVEHIKAWEKKHRELGKGDVVLLSSGYSDKYYMRLPEGRAFIADPLERKRTAWPDPDPGCMEYIAQKGVHHIVVDSPSMGPMPNLAEPVHIAGLKYGAIFTEGATGLGQLPATGTFYWCSGPRHTMAPCGEARALAVTNPQLANFLIAATRKKQVAELTVVATANLPLMWPGHRIGEHRQAYYVVDVYHADLIDVKFHTRIFDSNSTTHLVPPTFALPAPGFDNNSYAPEVRVWLAEYEKKYGPRGTSNMTTEKVPLSHTCGWARVIDVSGLVGTTDHASWPASPEITTAQIQNYEKQHGELKTGQIVLFHSGHVDQTYRPKSDACMVDPLAGKSEGWPAPGPEVIMYLKKRGIRCVATDAPSLGGVDAKRAMFTYWALGSLEMVGVEFLTNLNDIPEKAYFIFAPIKIQGCHGGPGRAMIYY